MYRATRLPWAAAVLAMMVCQVPWLGSATADIDLVPDPMVLQPLAGPFKSLRSWCRDQVKELGPGLSVQSCPDPKRLRPLNGPQRAVSLVHLGAHWQVDQDLWNIAIRTESGWFVQEDLPLCTGRGCANEPGAIELQPRSDGSTVLLFHFHHTEGGRVGDFSSEEDTQELILCELGTQGVPRCAEGAIPISAKATGQNEEETENLEVDVKLALAVGLPRADGKLVLTVTAKRRKVRGNSVEAKAWRSRLAKSLGEHVIALPEPTLP